MVCVGLIDHFLAEFSDRHYLMHLSAYVVWHARQMAIKIAATTACVDLFRKVYERLLLFECSPPAC